MYWPRAQSLLHGSAEHYYTISSRCFVWIGICRCSNTIHPVTRQRFSYTKKKKILLSKYYAFFLIYVAMFSGDKSCPKVSFSTCWWKKWTDTRIIVCITSYCRYKRTRTTEQIITGIKFKVSLSSAPWIFFSSGLIFKYVFYRPRKCWL